MPKDHVVQALNVNGVGNVEGPPLMIPLTSQDGLRANSPPPWYSATSDNTQDICKVFPPVQLDLARGQLYISKKLALNIDS